MEEGISAQARWSLRTVPAQLVGLYRDEGWWTDDTLGSMVAAGLRERSGAGFSVRSKVRPAGPVRRRRSQPVRWRARCARVRATSWCSVAELGRGRHLVLGRRVLAPWSFPIVHSYGSRRSTTSAGDVARRRDHHGTVRSQRLSPDIRSAARPTAARPLARRRRTAANDRRPAPAFASLVDGEPLRELIAADPDGPAVTGSRQDDTRPERRRALIARSVSGPANWVMTPRAGAADHRLTGRTLHGMLNAPGALLRDRPVNLIDVRPGESCG